MRYFKDLKAFVDEKKEGYHEVGDLCIQVYAKGNFNISIPTKRQPVMKFEDRKRDNNVTHVFMADEDGIIDYSIFNEIKKDDKIEKLIDLFPENESVRIVVGELFKI